MNILPRDYRRIEVLQMDFKDRLVMKGQAQIQLINSPLLW